MDRNALFEESVARHFGDKFYQESGFIKTWTTSWEHATAEQKAEAAKLGVTTLAEYIAFMKQHDKARLRAQVEKLFTAIDRGDIDYLYSLLSNRTNTMSRELFSKITGRDITKANSQAIWKAIESL